MKTILCKADPRSAAGAANNDFRETIYRRCALALFVATTLPAGAAVGFPHFGKKKQDQNVLPSRKLTAAQNALIDKAIAREKEVIKTVKERAPLVETYIQNMRPDPVTGPGS